MEGNSKQSAGELLIGVQDLVKHYGPIRAVDGISFEVRRGDVLGFLGPNGAGKTTAMKMITGFVEPDHGRVTVAGHDLTHESLEARRKMGYLPETAPAYGEMTVAGFLEFIAEVRGVGNVAAALDRVIEAAALGRVVHQTIETLSKGFQRRVSLAQALIHDPEVLILDEPTDGLDPNQKAVVQELIVGLSKGRAIVLSTHILDEAERVCNRALVISEGKILVDSTPEALISRAPNHNVMRLVLDASAVPDLLTSLEGKLWCDRVERLSETTIDVYPQHGDNHLGEMMELTAGLEIHSIHLQEGRLNELFRDITRGVEV